MVEHIQIIVTRTYIYICLCDVGGFLVVNVVMYGDEEKCTTKVMICFSDWVLWVV